MDNTHTPQPVAPAQAMPQTPMSPPVSQVPVSGGNGDSTKLLMVVLVVVVLLGCGLGAVILYKQMNTAKKAPATNYVVDTPVSASPTDAAPTVPPVLSQPVAEDASGIDNEIKILDETVSSTDSTTIKTQDIQDVTK